MIKTGKYVTRNDRNAFIFIKDIHDEDSINEIKDYLKRNCAMDYECSYTENNKKIHFKCTNFKTATDTKRYSFYLSNNSYLLIVPTFIHYNIYPMSKKMFDSAFIECE